jgi:hypothetical protein
MSVSTFCAQFQIVYYYYNTFRLKSQDTAKEINGLKGSLAMRVQNFIERIAYEGSRRSMKGHFPSYLFDKVSGDVREEEGRSPI